MIEPDLTGKVPSNVRQRYLNAIIDECIKTVNTEAEAIEKVS